MVKRKAHSASQPEPSLNASSKSARQKVVEPSTAIDPTAPEAQRGTRRAKANALENPVWKQLAPGGSRKAAAVTITPANKAVRKRKPKAVSTRKVKRVEVGDTDVEDDGNEAVSIPVPSAPIKTKNHLNHVAPASQPGAGRSRVIVDHLELSDDDATASSVTETDGPLSEDGEDTETEDETDNVADSHNAVKTTAAEKRFMAEHVFWSDQANIAPPSLSATTAASKFVIQGEPIDISDGEAVDSPTANVASTTSRIIKAEPLDNAVTIPGPLAQGNMLPVSGSTTDWPWYTNLMKGSGSREISLSVQTYELKVIIRKAMNLVEGRIRFENAFPSLEDRSIWYCLALLAACRGQEATSLGGVKLKYVKFRERMVADEKYVNDISALLNPRISLLRGNTKTAAVINTRTGYGLHAGSAALVQELLQQKRYIYPHQNGAFRRDKPFEHAAIIGTLRDDLFGGMNSIVKSYPSRFKAGMEDTYCLTDSMVALAATAVFAVLKEWENGPHVPTHFTTNVFTDIYVGHIKDLKYIKERNIAAYRSMMRRLCRLAMGRNNVQANVDNIIDVENMSIDLDTN